MQLIHYGHGNKIDFSLIEDACNSTNGLGIKPEPGTGLWSSPVDSEWGWKDWCESENYRTDELSTSFVFELRPDACILVIDNKFDLRKLIWKCEVENFGYKKYSIDFEALSEIYDAIWLTSNGQYETRFCSVAGCGDLYGWDVESVLVLNKEAIQGHDEYESQRPRCTRQYALVVKQERSYSNMYYVNSIGFGMANMTTSIKEAHLFNEYEQAENVQMSTCHGFEIMEV